MNMGYCRFENTLRDLKECALHMEDDDLSQDEKQARRKLVRACSIMLSDLGVTIDPDEMSDALGSLP